MAWVGFSLVSTRVSVTLYPDGYRYAGHLGVQELRQLAFQHFDSTFERLDNVISLGNNKRWSVDG